MNTMPREQVAALEDLKGNVAIANGLLLKARRHFRIADALRRSIEVEAIHERKVI